MRRMLIGKWICILTLCSVLCIASPAEVPNCHEVVAMARMVRATSTNVLTAEKQKAGNSYREQLVFTTRLTELNPTDKQAAAQLLALVPQNDEQDVTWMTLGDSLCDSEPVSDMMSLGQLGERLPRDLAKAVLLVPEKLHDYVAYALTSTQDPHSDYAVRMQVVCRNKHAEFMKAVAGLSADKKNQFIKHVFNPDGCHALALPEAE